MNEIPKYFWPIGRDLLRNRRYHTKELNRLRALITYQLLFGGRIVIRDSDYINMLAFRCAVTNARQRTASDDDKFFGQLFDSGSILISRRRGQTLGDVAEQLGRGAGVSPIVPRQWYKREAPDLQYFDARTVISAEEVELEFSVQDAAEYYTGQVLAMLSRSVEPFADESFRLKALERIGRHLEHVPTINWTFFRPDGEFWSGFSGSYDATHLKFLDFVVGQAAHASYIPERLGINPIYTQDAVPAIEFWRADHLRRRELTDQCVIDLGRGFSFSDYIDVLSLLSFDELNNLIVSDEATGFRRACLGLAFHGAPLSEVTATYRDYRKLIDSVLLRRYVPLLASGGQASVSTFIGYAMEEAVDQAVEIVMDEVVGGVVPFWQLGRKVAYFIRKKEFPDQTKVRTAREADQSLIAAEIQRLQAEGVSLRQTIALSEGLEQDRFIRQVRHSDDGDILISDVL